MRYDTEAAAGNYADSNRFSSAISYTMPQSPYGMNHYGSPQPSYPSGYPPVSQHQYADTRSSTSASYAPSYVSSSSPQHDQHRRNDLPPYQPPPPAARSSYAQPQSLNHLRTTSAAQNYSSFPAPHSNLPSQPLGSTSSGYPPAPIYPPTTYSVSDYHQPLPTMYPASQTTSAVYPPYEPAHTSLPPPATSLAPPLSSSPSSQNNVMMPRIVNARPKPQCWEHGCNGRQFSTFSNLLRHQREKSGTASKSFCPRCGAEFTRTTARNGHMAHDKCKPRRPSESSR